jgi:hypothetical protein
LAAQQLGYYHATVEGTDKMRAALIQEQGGEIRLPPLDYVETIWSAWRDAGKATSDGPLSWQEIEVYGRIHELTRDEMVLLRKMSQSYLAGLSLTHSLAKEPLEGSVVSLTDF